MPTLSSKYYPVRKILFFLGEGLLISASVLMILVLVSGWEIFVVAPAEYLLRAGTVTLTFQLSLYFGSDVSFWDSSIFCFLPLLSPPLFS